ncbi:MAG TPA: DUF4912 domain-containing protein [Pirellulales bacterium]|nr:DUF4912 domain-containing protein [Pirellulales bacterium]
MTAETLSSKSVKDLAQMAKRRGVHGWHSMRKDQLIRALLRLAASKTATNGHAKNGHAKNGHLPKSAARRSAMPRAVSGKPAAASKARSPQALRKLAEAKAKIDRYKDLASSNDDANGPAKDRLIVMVRGPFWLHAWWQLSRNGVSRAQAALGQEWHAARPVLRLYEVSVGTTTSSAERPLRDIEIHGGVNDWYIDVKDAPKSHRLDIGYLAPSGKFFVLARSNTVTTPTPGARDSIDENWSEVAENFDRIYAMSGGYESHAAGELQELFEERLRRPMGSPMVTQYGAGIESLLPRKRGFRFEVDAELLVFGSTEPDAHVTLQGEPVKLREDGTFTMRFSLPNCRQVIPAVATSHDGFEQRTVVLAVERNTKAMEPLLRDTSNE